MESSIVYPLVAVPGAGAKPLAVEPLRFAPARELLTGLGALAAVGAVCVVAGVALAPERVWPAILLSSLYLVGMGLAGTFFVALQGIFLRLGFLNYFLLSRYLFLKLVVLGLERGAFRRREVLGLRRVRKREAAGKKPGTYYANHEEPGEHRYSIPR